MQLTNLSLSIFFNFCLEQCEVHSGIERKMRFPHMSPAPEDVEWNLCCCQELYADTLEPPECTVDISIHSWCAYFPPI